MKKIKNFYAIADKHTGSIKYNRLYDSKRDAKLDIKDYNDERLSLYKISQQLILSNLKKSY